MGFDLLKPFADVSHSIGLDSFVNAAATTAGHAVGVIPAGSQVTSVKPDPEAIRSIPVIGAPLYATLDVTGSYFAAPFQMADGILHGKGIDQVVVDQFKRYVRDTRDVAPIAQTIISVVPGIGTGISAGIGAALALSEGQSIGDAALAAAKGALPGGALAGAAFEAGQAAVSGKPADAAIAALGTFVDLSPAAKASLKIGLDEVGALAQGHGSPSTADAAAAKALSTLPAKTRKIVEGALKVGIAMRHARNLQGASRSALRHPDVKHAIASMPKDAVASAARSAVGVGAHGFDVGHGLLQHKVTPFQVATARSALSPTDQRGFDVAAALHTGRVSAAAPPASSTAAQVGYAVARGAASSSPAHAAALKSAVGSLGPDAHAGVHLADSEIRRVKIRGLAVGAGLAAGAAAVGASVGGVPGAIIGGVGGLVVDLVVRR